MPPSPPDIIVRAPFEALWGVASGSGFFWGDGWAALGRKWGLGRERLSRQDRPGELEASMEEEGLSRAPLGGDPKYWLLYRTFSQRAAK